MVALVAQIAQRMQVNDTYANIAYNVPSYPSPFKPTKFARVVNMLWFMALGLSLMSSVMSMLAKQWLYEYMGHRDSPSTDQHREQAHLRQYRYEGLGVWKVAGIIAWLPLTLHIALLLFGIGLAFFLWELDKGCAQIVIGMTCATSAVYIITMILPSIITSCPFKTPLSHLLSDVSHIVHRGYRIIVPDRKPRLFQAPPIGVDVLLSNEKLDVQKQDSELDRKCLEWLRDNTRNPDIVAVASDVLTRL